MSTPQRHWAAVGFDPRETFVDCVGRAQHYRRLIEVENLWTPHELQALVEVQSAFNDEIRVMLEKTAQLLLADGRPMRPFDRHDLTPEVTLYRDPAAGQEEERHLLIAFCGNANRMMLPTSVFLNQLPEQCFDVLMLRDPSMLHYLKGIQGFAADPMSLLERIREVRPVARYREISVLGTSAGGGPALYFAIALGAARGISVGGTLPVSAPSIVANAGEPGAPTGRELDVLFAAANSVQRPTLSVVFGERYAPDIDGANALQSRFPRCRRIRIRGLDSHGVFPYLARKGTMRALMKTLLSPHANVQTEPAR